MNPLVIVCLLVALIGQWYDSYTTQKAITENKGTESNPVSAWVIKHWGFVALYLIKMVPIPAAMLYLAATPQWGGALSLPWQTIPNLIYGAFGFVFGLMNHRSTGV